jgi:F0F1-type ATP synthase membrane subunit b/b'
VVKGTLLRQQAEIKRLEYELHKARQSDEKIIEKALKEARLSRKELEEFISTHFWAD